LTRISEWSRKSLKITEGIEKIADNFWEVKKYPNISDGVKKNLEISARSAQYTGCIKKK
jgi:hypothetical protein